MLDFRIINSNALSQESNNLDSYLDTKFLKLNHAVRLLKSVIHAKKLSKKFGMGLTSIYKTINIIFQEYFSMFLESEKSGSKNIILD